MTYSPTDGPACGTTYEFRVRAFGDGDTYTEMWGVESATVTVETANCDPEFAPSSYSFSIPENAASRTLVGTVLATDEDGDPVTYLITAGNSDGKFSLGDVSGEVTVADVLDYETISSYTLTVEATDGRGGTATTTVEITVTDVAEDPPPAPSGLSVSLTDSTFTTTWTALDGAARYEVQHHVAESEDYWTSLPETTGTSVTYSPTDGPACGTTYEFRVRAFGDGDTYTEMWGVESAVESVTTPACNRAPSVDSSTYSFSIAETATTTALVGTVSATDPDDDALTYAITGGNEDGKFDIGSGTGQIAVAGTLDPDAAVFHVLTVKASGRARRRGHRDSRHHGTHDGMLQRHSRASSERQPQACPRLLPAAGIEGHPRRRRHPELERRTRHVALAGSHVGLGPFTLRQGPDTYGPESQWKRSACAGRDGRPA